MALWSEPSHYKKFNLHSFEKKKQKLRSLSFLSPFSLGKAQNSNLLRRSQPVVVSGGLAAVAAAGCLFSFSLFPPPLSRRLPPLCSSADILTVVVSLSSPAPLPSG